MPFEMYGFVPLLRGPPPLFAFPPIPAEADGEGEGEGEGASEMKAWAASKKSGVAVMLVAVMTAAAAARRKLVEGTMLRVYVCVCDVGVFRGVVG